MTELCAFCKTSVLKLPASGMSIDYLTSRSDHPSPRSETAAVEPSHSHYVILTCRREVEDQYVAC